MNIKKTAVYILSLFLVFSLLLPHAVVTASASGPTLTTTLKDGAVVKNDRLTFDVCARNQAGQKIASAVTHNGERIAPVWEDSDKTSYTLILTKEGENTVVVSASSDGGRKKQLTYHITYIPTEKGQPIGSAVISVEVFTLGCGYLTEPELFPIRAGETAAETLVRLLHENGFVCYYGGAVEDGFYLAYIADGTASEKTYNGYKKSGTAEDPKRLGLTPSIPDYLHKNLFSSMDFYDPGDYEKNWEGHLGEFVISSGSGWMYCVNNTFPNVGFSDVYLSDGDVVRVQFTLGYGADIGGISALGGQIPGVENQPETGYYQTANKDELTLVIANARASGLLAFENVRRAYSDALSVAARLDAPQSAADGAASALKSALANPVAETEKPAETEKSAETEKPAETGKPTETGKPDETEIHAGTDTDAPTDTAGESGTPADIVETDAPPKSPPPLLSIAQGIIDWKKADVGSPKKGDLLCDAFLELAGTTAGDWYPIGLSRIGASDNFDGYLAVLRDKVEERYGQPGRLSAAKATEWHRIILSVLAAGGDPTHFGTDENGQPINLIADGTYDRGKTTPLGRQGINGWIWGLIALDGKRYEIPNGAYYTREDIIFEILSKQLSDGGWALSGKVSDPDLTAMAVQALAPYYESGEQEGISEKTEAEVCHAVDKALLCLSSMQLPTGDYASWGTQNVESTDQVIIALCCLGIDPQSDARFIKNGNTLLDGVLRYRQPDGGFAHSYDHDPNNPASVPGESNSMAGEQTLLAMAALIRQQNGDPTLYDFRSEEGGDDHPVVFSDEDRRAVDDLPSPLSTEQYVTVTALLDKLLQSEEFARKEEYLQKLTEAKARISEIQAEVDALNEEIREKLYPFESISLRDKKTVDAIISRYDALGAYDRTKISHWDDVIKAKTQIDTLQRAIIIGVVLAATAAAASVFLIISIRKKRRRHADEMEELAARFADEDEEEDTDGKE